MEWERKGDDVELVEGVEGGGMPGRGSADKPHPDDGARSTDGKETA